MYKQTTNGGPSGGNRKYPNEYGYEADMGKGLYDPEIFSDMSFDTLRRYNNRHTSLLVSDFTRLVTRSRSCTKSF